MIVIMDTRYEDRGPSGYATTIKERLERRLEAVRTMRSAWQTFKTCVKRVADLSGERPSRTRSELLQTYAAAAERAANDFEIAKSIANEE